MIFIESLIESAKRLPSRVVKGNPGRLLSKIEDIKRFWLEIYSRTKGSFIHVFALIVSASVVTYLGWLVDNWKHDNVVRHVSIFSIALKQHYILIEVLLAVTIIISIEIIARLYQDYKRSSMADVAGMFYCSANCNNRQVRKSHKFLREQSVRCNHINILLASGWDTFVQEHTPLHKSLRNCSEIKILLAYPLSTAIQKRAEKLCINFDQYKTYIYDSIKYLKDIKSDSRSVKIKMYEGYPLWKLIFLDPYVWVQQYPIDDHVQNSPCYAFSNASNKSKQSLYDHFSSHFFRIWNDLNIGTYNFETEELEFFDKRRNLIAKKPIQ